MACLFCISERAPVSHNNKLGIISDVIRDNMVCIMGEGRDADSVGLVDSRGGI